MNRFIELKYNDDIIKNHYNIENILINNNFSWLLDCEFDKLKIEIDKNILIINSGIWYNGKFNNGVIRDIFWFSGTFTNGVIYNGYFKEINIIKGIIYNGYFINAYIHFADVKDGEFKRVKFLMK